MISLILRQIHIKLTFNVKHRQEDIKAIAINKSTGINPKNDKRYFEIKMLTEQVMYYHP